MVSKVFVITKKQKTQDSRGYYIKQNDKRRRGEATTTAKVTVRRTQSRIERAGEKKRAEQWWT